MILEYKVYTGSNTDKPESVVAPGRKRVDEIYHQTPGLHAPSAGKKGGNNLTVSA